nr:RNA-directed DNA polymerase, eukaryota [Tanacetum cinerariifolium]
MDIEENLVSSFAQKRLCIKTKQVDNIFEKFKVIFKGKVYMAHAKELFAWTPIFLDHKESEYISYDKSLHGAKNNSEKVVEQQSKDPFCIYEVLNKMPKGVAQDSDSSLSHPPGFTPEVSRQENDHRGVDLNTETYKVNSPLVLRSDSAGSSGGILCLWEATIFKKDYAMVYDNFIAIYGTWISNNSKVLIVVIYAPQSLSQKRVLWDCISSLIARWNGETIVMGDFNEDKKLQQSGAINSIKEDLIDIHKNLDSGNVSDEILLKRMELTRQLHDINQMEARDYVWKSKIKWAIEGDKNPKFFHGIINKKRSQLLIHGVFVDGDWNTDPEVVKDVFKDHFSTRFKQPAHGRLKLNISFPNRLSTDQVADMDRSVSRDEIRVAVWNCGENKSPGPDGYTFEFFSRYWRFIGSDFCSAIECFFESGSFPKGSNSSFIALIPKVTDAKLVTDFRPISLIGCVYYKVVTKILANRLATEKEDKLLVSAQTGASGFEALLFPQWLQSWLMGALLLNSLFCGLKQGDPLASYLFILIMESLHISFSRAISDGLFRGVMVGDSMSRKLAWADTVQKLRSRLSKWKVKTLSIGDRMTLLKSVLGACPLYNMSIYKVPKGVLKEMEAIRCNQWCRSCRKKDYLGLLDKVLTSKKNGGLEVSSFHALNRALLLKWVWRFLSQDGSLWYRVIQALYDASFELHPVNLSSIWCSILREMKMLISKGFDFVSHCKKRVDDGHNTRFWYDSWVFDQPLRVRFPYLFALETDKESMVASKLGSSSVDASFRRSVRDGVERQQLDDLNSFSGSVTLSASKHRWICDLNGDGVFRVKEVRTILDDNFLPSAADATRWVKYISIKINVFAWRARLDRLPPLCGLVPEDIHHVLFRCDTAKLVFRRICRLWDLDWHDLLSFSDWNAWFSAIRLPSRIKLILEGVFYVAWWHLWVYRNQSIFAASPPRRSVIFENIVSRSFTWKFNRYSFFEMPKVLLLAWDRVFEIKDALGNKQYKPEDMQELFRKLFNDVQNIHEELAEYINTPGWNRPAFYDDNDDDDVDYTIAITPVLSTEETDNSLSMGEEHLDTIPVIETDEVIKSSVEDLVPILTKYHFEIVTKSNDDISSSDDDSLYNENIEYVEASPYDSEEFADELAHIISPPEYDCFYFRNLPDPGKKRQEKDKIGSKPDKNGKRGEARKSQSQSQSGKKKIKK